MLAGQKLVDSNNIEMCLFPMTMLYMSQSLHQLYAIDLNGFENGNRVYNCPCYAPFTCQVIYTGADHNIIFHSLDKVHFADGTIDYASILVAHSMTDVPQIGTIYQQGDLFYHTGNYGNSTGDHLHLEFARGHNRWEVNHLKNAIPPNQICFINDTEILRDLLGGWVTGDGSSIVTPPEPPTKQKDNFNFILFNRKRRFYNG